MSIMNERIREFLISENKSSAQFAEEIGVQPSGISHILSGRNNPSLDFVIKMLERYRNISSDWLLFGNGPMYKESKMPLLFDNSEPVRSRTDPGQVDTEISDMRSGDEGTDQNKPISEMEHSHRGKKDLIVKIVWFYDNNSFEEFYPRY